MVIIKPITALRIELAEITRICEEQSEPVYLIKNGTGGLVVIGTEAFERREAILNLRAKLLESEQQRLDGAPTYSTDEIRKYIKGLHNGKI